MALRFTLIADVFEQVATSVSEWMNFHLLTLVATKEQITAGTDAHPLAHARGYAPVPGSANPATRL